MGAFGPPAPFVSLNYFPIEITRESRLPSSWLVLPSGFLGIPDGFSLPATVSRSTPGSQQLHQHWVLILCKWLFEDLGLEWWRACQTFAFSLTGWVHTKSGEICPDLDGGGLPVDPSLSRTWPMPLPQRIHLEPQTPPSGLTCSFWLFLT